MPVEEKELAPGTSAFPVSRVNKIMKLDKDVSLASKEAIFLISKTTELAIGKLAHASHINARMQRREKLVKYQDLSQTIARPEWFFLQGDVLPKTVPLEKALSDREKALKASETGASATDGSAGDALMSSAGNTGLAPGASAVKKSRKKKVVAPAAGEGDGEGSAKDPEVMQVDA
ncbi:hypothetical protein BCR35DRAFT_154241 [Leucosporidium creatinivorum]|uniref:Transcription factor CBF/NF-Y/archaeal histone domain-containing protein n=1 Tax=Leucosporidium creatinivorum TaxID=106004 RepID=A0A1Y2G1C0_9BASI|nr:hypothetical protein BCR35DRAFT_154241 [Leucosporidium creatinivorum]